MQIVKSQSHIAERVLRDKEGKLVRARFYIYENAGRVKARLIDIVYIAENVILKISGFVKKVSEKFSSISIQNQTPVLVPQTIYSSGSKPRAPTHN
jgi:hypothetical protein